MRELSREPRVAPAGRGAGATGSSGPSRAPCAIVARRRLSIAGADLRVGERRDQPDIVRARRQRPCVSQPTAVSGSFSRSDSDAIRAARGAKSVVVRRQAAVLNQRLPRRLEVILSSRRSSRRARAPADRSGSVESPAAARARRRRRRRPAAARGRRASASRWSPRGSTPRARAPSRALLRKARSSRGRSSQTWPSAPVDLRLVRAALERAAQRQHGEIPVAGARLGQADGDLSRDVIAIEAGDHLQLIELLGVAVERAVEIRELLARRHQAGRQRDGRLERLDARRARGAARAGRRRAGSARRRSVRRGGACPSAPRSRRRCRGRDSGRAPACS